MQSSVFRAFWCSGSFSFVTFSHPYRALSFIRPLRSVLSPAGVSFSLFFFLTAARLWFVPFESNVRVRSSRLASISIFSVNAFFLIRSFFPPSLPFLSLPSVPFPAPLLPFLFFFYECALSSIPLTSPLPSSDIYLLRLFYISKSNSLLVFSLEDNVKESIFPCTLVTRIVSFFFFRRLSFEALCIRRSKICRASDTNRARAIKYQNKE